jgi:hypothetical protein
MTINRRIATELREVFGANAGARSVATHRASARDAAYDLMWDYEARGLIDDSPGPRGGAGWRLNAKGAALVAQCFSADVRVCA